MTTDNGTTAAHVNEALRSLGATVATAESLTGGRLATLFTALPGSSATYVGGVVTYATAAKISVLGVPAELVDEHGVVSEACARAMAEGARSLLGATYAVSTTGVAGPDRQEGKPVGTVYVGVAGPDGTAVTRLALDGDREGIQLAAVAAGVSAVASILGVGVAQPAGRGAEDSGLG